VSTPPPVSVIVPTFNRIDTLPEVLGALLGQEDVARAEVIVVNDGSELATSNYLDEWSAGLKSSPRRGWSVRVLHQENKGPAVARNRGVQAASGRIVAFLGDDTVPFKGWLRCHLAAHRRWVERGIDANLLGVIGYTGWHSRMRLNPFLRYINDYGLQFGYALIENPESVAFNFFYTSNLSVARSALLEEPFDAGFPYPAWEDIEVSYRLNRKGFRLVYESEAKVAHDHPTDVERFGERQEKAGYCAVVFFNKHPELGGFLGLGPEGPPALPDPDRNRRIWWLVRTLQRIMESWWWRWLPLRWSRTVPKSISDLWEQALRYHYIVGLRRGWRELSGTADIRSGVTNGNGQNPL